MKKEINLDLDPGIKRLKILTSQIVNTKFVGGYKSLFKGRGLEFEDYREYTPNDDASSIDWKASVRSKKLLVREFVEERNLNVFFLIDVSSSMIYSSTEKLKIEYACEIAVALSYVVLNAGDSIGFALFNDKIIKMSPPKTGFTQYNNLVRALVNPNLYGGKYDLNQALKFILAYLKEASIVIIISDFIGLKNDWERYLKMVSKKFDVIGIMIRDPLDRELPSYNGQAIFEDPYSGRQILVNPATIGDDYRRDAIRQEQIIKNAFLKANSNFIELMTDKSYVEPLTNLFLRRTLKIR